MPNFRHSPYSLTILSAVNRTPQRTSEQLRLLRKQNLYTDTEVAANHRVRSRNLRSRSSTVVVETDVQTRADHIVGTELDDERIDTATQLRVHILNLTDVGIGQFIRHIETEVEVVLDGFLLVVAQTDNSAKVVDTVSGTKNILVAIRFNHLQRIHIERIGS